MGRDRRAHRAFRRARRAGRLAAAVLLMAGIAACAPRAGGTVEGAAAGTTLPLPGPAARPGAVAATPEGREVAAAYRRFWEDVRSAAATADASSPRLAAHATGGQLAILARQLSRFRREGVVYRGPIRVDPAVTRLAAGTATVVDCHDDRDFIRYDATTGERLGGPPGRRRKVVAELRYEYGGWKVADLTYGEERC